MFSSQDPDGLEPSGADAVLTRSFTDSSLLSMMKSRDFT